MNTPQLTSFSHRAAKLIRITTVPLSLDKLLGRQLSYMNHFYEVVAISADEKELKKVAEKYGVKHYPVEMTREITPIQDLKSVWKLYLFLKKEKPEMVHTHTPKAGIVGMLAAFLAGVPVRMHTVAGLPLLEKKGVKRKILNFVERLTCSLATKVYPNSFGLKKIIIQEKFCKPHKLKVLGNGSSNGIDTEYFAPDLISQDEQSMLQDKLGIGPNDFVFIFVGRLVRDKGINELVSAFTALQESLKNQKFHNPVKMILVGPLEPDLDPLNPETLHQIEFNPQIIYVDFQDDVRPYMAISDALVFPSYREGFPNVVLQSGAMELPAIVSDINGCNEIIKNGVNGIIVPAKNSDALEEAMRQIYEDSHLHKNLKYNSRQEIISKYDQKLVWNALWKEYQNQLLQLELKKN